MSLRCATTPLVTAGADVDTQPRAARAPIDSVDRAEEVARAIYDAYVDYVRPDAGTLPFFLAPWEQLPESSMEQNRYIARRLLASGLIQDRIVR